MATQLQTFATLAEYNTARANRTLVCPNVSKISATGDIKFLRVNPQSGVGIKALVNGVANYFTLAEWNALETKPAAADIIGEYVYVDGDGFVVSQNWSSAINWSTPADVAIQNCAMSNNIQVAYGDMDGLANTIAIITAKNAGLITACPAADWARSQFGGQGFLLSVGQLELLRLNLSDINLCRQAITAAGQARSNIVLSQSVMIGTSTQLVATAFWKHDGTIWRAENKTLSAYFLAGAVL